MAKIRMTEKDFKGLIKESVVKLLNESIDQNELLSSIVQRISEMSEISANNGDNELEVELSSDSDFCAYVMYSVNDQRYLSDNGGDGYITPRDYDVNGEFYVDVDKIEVYLDGESVGTYYDENHMLADALRDNITVEDIDLPYEKDYFNDMYDDYDD